MPKPPKADCPRCKLPLSNSRYEGVAVQFCEQCWGYFIGLREFEKILHKKDESFSKAEASQRVRQHREDGKMLRCVSCASPMAKLKLDDTPPFFIDICREHGVWLDTGEIKRAQILDEKVVGSVRAALRHATHDDDDDDD